MPHFRCRPFPTCTRQPVLPNPRSRHVIAGRLECYLNFEWPFPSVTRANKARIVRAVRSRLISSSQLSTLHLSTSRRRPRWKRQKGKSKNGTTPASAETYAGGLPDLRSHAALALLGLISVSGQGSRTPTNLWIDMESLCILQHGRFGTCVNGKLYRNTHRLCLHPRNSKDHCLVQPPNRNTSGDDIRLPWSGLLGACSLRTHATVGFGGGGSGISHITPAAVRPAPAASRGRCRLPAAIDTAFVSQTPQSRRQRRRGSRTPSLL